MAAAKTLALGVLVLGAAATAVQAAPVSRGSWRWTTWVPGQGIVLTDLSNQPTAVVLPPAPNVIAAPALAAPTTPAAAPESMSRWTTVPTVAAPDPSPTPPPTPAPPPAPSFTPAPAPAAPSFSADAYINLGAGPYSEASVLTTGGAQPWYNSAVVQNLYGGTPNDQQRADFSNAILQRVEQTYQLAGIPLHVTADPNVPTAHSLSVVSNTGYSGNTDAIGITDVGKSGFSFIDKFGAVQSVDQLEWAIAHNVAHELMHAFGGDHHDTTGTYLDGASATWALLTNPGTTFGPDSVRELLSKNFRQITPNFSLGAEEIDGQRVIPEPSTLVLWGLAGAAAMLYHRRRAARLAAS